jgi:hypothetical protein
LIKTEIENILSRLNLSVKENWQIFPVDKRGIDFLGYRFFHDYILLRSSIKSNLKKSARKIKKTHNNMKTSLIINSMMSYYGWFKYANCKNLQNSIFDEEMCHIIKHRCIHDEITNPLKKVV